MLIISVLVLLSMVMYILRHQTLSVLLSVYVIALIFIIWLFLIIMKEHDIAFQFHPERIVLGIIVGCMIYMIEVVVFFIITKKWLVMNIKFYFKGTVNHFVFFVSMIILIIEEIVWRYSLFFNQVYSVLAVLVSSLGFGMCHINFGRLQVIFKSFLGIILAFIYLLFKDIWLVIVIHTSYNYFTLNKLGKGALKWP